MRIVTELIIQEKKRSQISGFILERTAKRMKQFFQQRLTAGDTGITIDQWVVLQVLNKGDGISQLDIAKATFKDAPTITRIIDLLCKKKLTRRVADPEDRRRYRIYLTREGRKKVVEVLPIIEEARRTAWQKLDDEDMDHLIRILNAIFENLGGGDGEIR